MHFSNPFLLLSPAFIRYLLHSNHCARPWVINCNLVFNVDTLFSSLTGGSAGALFLADLSLSVKKECVAEAAEAVFLWF